MADVVFLRSSTRSVRTALQKSFATLTGHVDRPLPPHLRTFGPAWHEATNNGWATEVVEIKDAGDEFHWSRPRIVGLAFGAVASPLFVAFAVFGHEEIGGIVWFAACVGLTIAYVRPTRLRSFVQRLIPTTAEKREGRAAAKRNGS